MLSAGIVFALMVASQGVFLAFMILLKKRLHKGFFLAAYFATFSGIIFSWILVWGGIRINLYPPALHTPLQFFLGPLLLLYIRRNGKAERKYELMLPALVTLIYSIYWIAITFQFSITQRPDILIPFLKGFGIASMVSMALYVVRLLRHDWSGPRVPLVISLMVFVAGIVLYEVLQLLGMLNQVIDYWLVGIMFALFYLSGYFYLIRSGQKFSLKNHDPQAALVLDRIRKLLQQEHQYLKKGYRIEELAVQLGEPVNQVSKSIREVAQSNFKDFINQYRIEHAKQLLLNSDLKIEAITDESGFNNKVSFIENFKKIEGVRPTEYRKMGLSGKAKHLD